MREEAQRGLDWREEFNRGELKLVSQEHETSLITAIFQPTQFREWPPILLVTKWTSKAKDFRLVKMAIRLLAYRVGVVWR